MSGPKRSNIPSRRAVDRSEGRSPASPDEPRQPGASLADGRAQTTMDFAIGVSLFLVIVVFVFMFVPGILEPFDLTGDQDTIHSERIASQLASGMLGSPENPYVVDRFCTVKFFTDGSPGECGYSGTTADEKLHLKSWRPYNISIEGDLDGDGAEILCWDETNDQFSDCPSGTQLAVGRSIPVDSDATITSRRIISMHGENVELKVVLW